MHRKNLYFFIAIKLVLLMLATIFISSCESETEKNIRESKERGAANVAHFARKVEKNRNDIKEKKCASDNDCEKK
jgi:lipoprotein